MLMFQAMNDTNEQDKLRLSKFVRLFNSVEFDKK